ncbi:CLUMA_CG005205, isoform A [Clunio marinus]|uniref:Sensory neuron membrane protein 1 n=1 Tax=Clunio marinus TaxID=568069 RepID=A0A1J1HW08_9DIPT|nr:CLUMA_CG005205, isoform A [Clunio marinus]
MKFDKEKLNNLNFKKIALISSLSLVGALIFSYGLFPPILRFVLKLKMQLKKGSLMRTMFDVIPFPLVFKIHVFNITNPDAIMRGEKPIVADIGPYVFEEWKLRENWEEDVVEDTLTYDFKNRFIFRPELSNGLTGNEIVQYSNLVLLGGLMAVKRDREAMLPMVTKALMSIFKNPDSVFMRARVMDILFDGLKFECKGDDFTVDAVCSAIKSEAQGLKEIDETTLSISIFGSKNDTSFGRFHVLRGVRNISELGQIQTFNGESMQSVWDGDECNKNIGTDSTLFPPFMTQDMGLWTFTPDICMSLRAHYLEPSSYAGMPTWLYSLDFGDFKNEPEKHCFCYDPPDDCPPKGTIDLMPCVGVPVYGSKPHFLDTDPKLLENVGGLNPNRTIHDVFVNIEGISGTIFEGYKRFQLNLAIEPIEDFEMMSKLPKVLLPLLWLEESVQLNKTYTNILKYQLFLGLKFNFVVKWMGIVCGTAGMLLSGFMLYQQQQQQKQQSPTTVSSATSAIDDDDKVNKNIANNVRSYSVGVSEAVK